MDRNDQLLRNLYRHYLVMKTFHFQTKLAFRHTKADEYLQKYLANMDKLMEVIQGIDGVVATSVIDINVATRNDEDIYEELANMTALLQLERSVSSVDSIIDDMQNDIHQLAYLFGFK